MTNAEKMTLLQTVFALIFNSKAANTDITTVRLTTNTGVWNGRWFKDATTGQQTLRGFDFTCNLGNRIISLRCLEQNPNKTDNFGNLKKFSVLARQGHSIMWVIDRNGSFLGRIQDGQWHGSNVQAVQRQTYAYNNAMYVGANNPQQFPAQNRAMNQAEHIPDPEASAQLDEIPQNTGIPEYLMEQIAGWEEPPETEE